TLLTGSFGVQFDADTTANTASIATLNTDPDAPVISNVNVSGAQASSNYTLVQVDDQLTMSIGTQGTAGYKEQTITVSTGGSDVAQVMNFDEMGISFTY